MSLSLLFLLLYIFLSHSIGALAFSPVRSPLSSASTLDSDRAGWRIVERLRRVERRASAAPSPSRLDDDDGDGEVAHGRAPSAIPILTRPSGGDEILLALAFFVAYSSTPSPFLPFVVSRLLPRISWLDSCNPLPRGRSGSDDDDDDDVTIGDL